MGSTPGEAWMAMFYLERACQAQAHGPVRRPRARVDRAQERAQEEVKAQAAAVPWVANLAWPGWPSRRLDRLSPGYDA